MTVGLDLVAQITRDSEIGPASTTPLRPDPSAPRISPKLFPTVETIAAAFWRLTLNGILPHHAFDTVWRLLAGFALAAIAGVAIGIVMGRSRRAEDIGEVIAAGPEGSRLIVA